MVIDLEQTYGEYLSELYAKEAKKHTNLRYIGYNTVYGSRMYGTLKDVDAAQCIEMPVCENLMMGMAVGMALEGMLPVVCFERHDFLLIGLDALVNHVDKLPWLSGKQYKLPILIRAIVGSKEPIDAGPMHTQDYTAALTGMLKHTPVFVPTSSVEFERAWNSVGNTPSGAVVIVEYKDYYNKQFHELN